MSTVSLLPPDDVRPRAHSSAVRHRAPVSATRTPALTTESLAEVEHFRYVLRRFMRASEEAAYREGLTPRQHQLLLALKGYPERDYANIGELADRLQACPHGVVGIVDRLERAGLVVRRRGQDDRRQVFIHLTPAGEASLARLSCEHLRELTSMRALLDCAPVPALAPEGNREADDETHPVSSPRDRL